MSTLISTPVAPLLARLFTEADSALSPALTSVSPKSGSACWAAAPNTGACMASC